MARISEKSELFRDRSEIVNDVVFALTTNLIHHAAKRAIIDQAIWVWSEYDGKYSSTLFWSNDAKQAKLNRLPIIHEHPVPRQVIREKLFALRKPSTTSVKRVLTRYCIGAVISKAEDITLNQNGLRSKMPEDWEKFSAQNWLNTLKLPALLP